MHKINSQLSILNYIEEKFPVLQALLEVPPIEPPNGNTTEPIPPINGTDPIEPPVNGTDPVLNGTNGFE